MGAKELNIGYFGEEGSFSHAIALKRFGAEAAYHDCASAEIALTELIGREIDLAVLPIENASSGTIADTIDQLIRLREGKAGDDFVVRECLAMPIKLVLLSFGKKPKVITSHPAALAHARSWLTAEYPHARIEPSPSTSAAAQRALSDADVAALASGHAAELYGLPVLRRDVQETIPNRTKFYVVAPRRLALPGAVAPTHTSLLFEAAHRPGSLVDALKVLSERGLNLTMIQSRPIPGRFDEYRFFIEFDGVPEKGGGDSKGLEALEALRAQTHRLSVLGSYPILDLP